MSSNLQFPIKIGSRTSELAIAQANQVKNKLLESLPDIKASDIEIITMQTTGDKLLDKDLSLFGGKSVFTKEIEEALLAKKIDIAVHSMKDVPAILPKTLFIKAIVEREEATDAFISNKYKNLLHLPKNAVIGTSSIRRKAILLYLRKDLKIIDFRGNINTRLRKLKEQDIDGIILATSGLKRCAWMLPKKTFKWSILWQRLSKTDARAICTGCAHSSCGARQLKTIHSFLLCCLRRLSLKTQ